MKTVLVSTNNASTYLRWDATPEGAGITTIAKANAMDFPDVSTAELFMEENAYWIGTGWKAEGNQ